VVDYHPGGESVYEATDRNGAERENILSDEFNNSDNNWGEKEWISRRSCSGS